MAAKREFLFIGFDSTHAAMSAEVAVKDAGISARLVPRPLPLGGARCGLALRVDILGEKDALRILEREGITPGGVLVLEDHP